jgi:hypothetical protein
MRREQNRKSDAKQSDALESDIERMSDANRAMRRKQAIKERDAKRWCGERDAMRGGRCKESDVKRAIRNGNAMRCEESDERAMRWEQYRERCGERSGAMSETAMRRERYRKRVLGEWCGKCDE